MKVQSNRKSSQLKNWNLILTSLPETD